jgi:hypothetical protein
MERRKFLVGMGSLAAGAAAAVGTGAVDNVEANRDISIAVEGDRDAYLQLNGTTSEYASTPTDGELSLDFGATTSGGGTGLNNGAVTSIDNVFKIKNQGTKPMVIWMDDGRYDPDIGDNYWSEANFHDKVFSQLATDGNSGNPGGYYNFFATENDGRFLNSFPFPEVAPDNINLNVFDNPASRYGAVLGAGDEVGVGAYFNTGAKAGQNSWSLGEIEDAQIMIWAYSEEYAEGVQ